MVSVDLSGIQSYLHLSDLDIKSASDAHHILTSRTGIGNEYTGWLSLPEKMDGEPIQEILGVASKIKKLGTALIVVGIGGSYLGARAAIELLTAQGCNTGNGDMSVFFWGMSIHPDELNRQIAHLGDRDFCVNVVSKSGGTLESALVFRVAKHLLEKKYGYEGAKERIFVTTDPSKGLLHDYAVAEHIRMLNIPPDVGGRYSVLSAVGLLPMAVAGIDIQKVIKVAQEEMECLSAYSDNNPACLYAAARQACRLRGKSVELLAYYDPSFASMAEWWKQLFGESEGKNGIGIFPASVQYNADLHSMGQFIQEGNSLFLETVVRFSEYNTSLRVPDEPSDFDRLNKLSGADFGKITDAAVAAVSRAHVSGGTPNIIISVPRRNETGFAELVCFFEYACAISAYISGVNPFDQPGVEAYKQNMRQILFEKHK